MVIFEIRNSHIMEQILVEKSELEKAKEVIGCIE